MVAGAASLATYIHSMRSAGTWIDERESNVLDGGAPFYGVYETSDGRYIAVGAIEPQFYARFVAGIGFEIDELPDQLDRSAWPTTRAMFRERFATQTREQWCTVFEGVDACVTPVLSMEEAPRHPHLADRASFVNVAGVTQPAPVPRFEGYTSPMSRPPAAAGVGGRAALHDWGVPEVVIARALDSGAIGLDG
jgi:alpha-methylacyl-CoA racemase